jgi:hypothetical protein
MSVCPRCAAKFTCAMADQTGQPCWCATMPIEPVLPIYADVKNDEAHCFCPVCMQEWQQTTQPNKTNALQ